MFATSEGPDQMPHFAASDLGLHCLPRSQLWDARHKLVNMTHRKNPKISDTGKFAVITLKVEQDGFFFRGNASKRCRGNCKRCRPSDLSLHCLPRPVCPKT